MNMISRAVLHSALSVSLLLFMAVASSAVLASGIDVGSAAEHEWISDPSELEARGFDPFDTLLRRLLPESHPLTLEERIAEESAIESIADVGGPGVRWASVQALDFQPLSDVAAYSTQGDFLFSCLPTGAPNRFADAPIHLRDDRRIRFFDVWMSDVDPVHDMNVVLYEACQPAFDPGEPVLTELAQAVTTGTPGEVFRFVSVPLNYVQNSTCSYFVRIRFDSCSAGTNLQFQKARVIWD